MKHWLPRGLSIALLIWWVLFIFFSNGFSIPSLFEWIFWVVLLLFAVTAWKREFLGGTMFLFLGLFYLLIGWGRVTFTGYFMVPLPLILVGVVFIVSDWKKRSDKND